MNLLRLIILVLVIWIVVAWIKRYMKRTAGPRTPRRIGNIVRCESCGLHVPEAEALRRADKFYCSVQHLKSAAGSDDRQNSG